MNKKDKPIYETPKVLPLGNLMQSAGGQCQSGSGEKNNCWAGPSAKNQKSGCTGGNNPAYASQNKR